MTPNSNAFCHSQQRHAHGLRTFVRGLGPGLLGGLLVLGACGAAASGQSGLPDAASATTATAQQEKSHMWMTVGERRFAVTLADTEAARAFAAMLPLSIDMADLNSNEKYAELSQSLPASASRPGTIRNGDLMLYGSTTLVVFYLSFSSPYAYTRLGRVSDPAGLAQALGKGRVRIAFSRGQDATLHPDGTPIRQ